MNEREYEMFMEASQKSSWSAMQRANGRNRLSDEWVDDECGYESEQDWTQDAM